MIVYDRAIEQRLKVVNKELEPFYIVDHSGGKFSLCGRINYIEREFGQAAFDAYAVEMGEPPCDEQGYITYGSGYDWESAFKEAFKDDKNLKRLKFDSESSMFCCYGDDLDMMIDFGSRIRELSLDTERFTPIVSAGIKNEAQRRAEEEMLEHTVRGQIMQHPTAEFYIRTPDADYKILRGAGKSLLNGSCKEVYSVLGDMPMDTADFLDQRISASQQDLFDEDSFKLMVDTEQEEILAPSFNM